MVYERKDKEEMTW